MKKTTSLLTGMAMVLGIAAPAQTRKPESPQQKIVEKYGLQEKLEEAMEPGEMGEGCRQPMGSEKNTYKDFRQLANRAQTPDALLIVCDSVLEHLEDMIMAAGNHETNVVAVQNLSRLPRKSAKQIMAHELTHIANKESYSFPGRDIAERNKFLQEVSEVAFARRAAGKPLTVYEIRQLEQYETIIIDRINQKIAANMQMEMIADAGGVILAAGPGCKINTEAMTQALEKTLGKTNASITHPGLETRNESLRENRADIRKYCQEYYRDVKANKPNKTPNRGR